MNCKQILVFVMGILCALKLSANCSPTLLNPEEWQGFVNATVNVEGNTVHIDFTIDEDDPDGYGGLIFQEMSVVPGQIYTIKLYVSNLISGNLSVMLFAATGGLENILSPATLHEGLNILTFTAPEAVDAIYIFIGNDFSGVSPATLSADLDSMVITTWDSDCYCPKFTEVFNDDFLICLDSDNSDKFVCDRWYNTIPKVTDSAYFQPWGSVEWSDDETMHLMGRDSSEDVDAPDVIAVRNMTVTPGQKYNLILTVSEMEDSGQISAAVLNEEVLIATNKIEQSLLGHAYSSNDTTLTIPFVANADSVLVLLFGASIGEPRAGSNLKIDDVYLIKIDSIPTDTIVNLIDSIFITDSIVFESLYNSDFTEGLDEWSSIFPQSDFFFSEFPLFEKALGVASIDSSRLKLSHPKWVSGNSNEYQTMGVLAREYVVDSGQLYFIRCDTSIHHLLEPSGLIMFDTRKFIDWYRGNSEVYDSSMILGFSGEIDGDAAGIFQATCDSVTVVWLFSSPIASDTANAWVVFDNVMLQNLYIVDTPMTEIVSYDFSSNPLDTFYNTYIPFFSGETEQEGVLTWIDSSEAMELSYLHGSNNAKTCAITTFARDSAYGSYIISYDVNGPNPDSFAYTIHVSTGNLLHDSLVTHGIYMRYDTTMGHKEDTVWAYSDTISVLITIDMHDTTYIYTLDNFDVVKFQNLAIITTELETFDSTIGTWRTSILPPNNTYQEDEAGKLTWLPEIPAIQLQVRKTNSFFDSLYAGIGYLIREFEIDSGNVYRAKINVKNLSNAIDLNWMFVVNSDTLAYYSFNAFDQALGVDTLMSEDSIFEVDFFSPYNGNVSIILALAGDTGSYVIVDTATFEKIDTLGYYSYIFDTVINYLYLYDTLMLQTFETDISPWRNYFFEYDSINTFQPGELEYVADSQRLKVTQGDFLLPVPNENQTMDVVYTWGGIALVDLVVEPNTQYRIRYEIQNNPDDSIDFAQGMFGVNLVNTKGIDEFGIFSAPRYYEQQITQEGVYESGLFSTGNNSNTTLLFFAITPKSNPLDSPQTEPHSFFIDNIHLDKFSIEKCSTEDTCLPILVTLDPWEETVNSIVSVSGDSLQINFSVEMDDGDGLESFVTNSMEVLPNKEYTVIINIVSHIDTALNQIMFVVSGDSITGVIHSSPLDSGLNTIKFVIPDSVTDVSLLLGSVIDTFALPNEYILDVSSIVISRKGDCLQESTTSYQCPPLFLETNGWMALENTEIWKADTTEVLFSVEDEDPDGLVAGIVSKLPIALGKEYTFRLDLLNYADSINGHLVFHVSSDSSFSDTLELKTLTSGINTIKYTDTVGRDTIFIGILNDFDSSTTPLEYNFYIADYAVSIPNCPTFPVYDKCPPKVIPIREWEAKINSLYNLEEENLFVLLEVDTNDVDGQYGVIQTLFNSIPEEDYTVIINIQSVSDTLSNLLFIASDSATNVEITSQSLHLGVNAIKFKAPAGTQKIYIEIKNDFGSTEDSSKFSYAVNLFAVTAPDTCPALPAITICPPIPVESSEWQSIANSLISYEEDTAYISFSIDETDTAYAFIKTDFSVISGKKYTVSLNIDDATNVSDLIVLTDSNEVIKKTKLHNGKNALLFSAPEDVENITLRIGRTVDTSQVPFDYTLKVSAFSITTPDDCPTPEPTYVINTCPPLELSSQNFADSTGSSVAWAEIYCENPALYYDSEGLHINYPTPTSTAMKKLNTIESEEYQLRIWIDSINNPNEHADLVPVYAKVRTAEVIIDEVLMQQGENILTFTAGDDLTFLELYPKGIHWATKNISQIVTALSLLKLDDSTEIVENYTEDESNWTTHNIIQSTVYKNDSLLNIKVIGGDSIYVTGYAVQIFQTNPGQQYTVTSITEEPNTVLDETQYSPVLCVGSNNRIEASNSFVYEYKSINKTNADTVSLTFIANSDTAFICIGSELYAYEDSVIIPIKRLLITASDPDCDLSTPSERQIPMYQEPETVLEKVIRTDLPVGAIDGYYSTTPSGGATYTIPLKIVPGINGTQPDLAIVYNSQSGNGLLGYGWNLNGLSAISLDGKDWYYDNKQEAAILGNSPYALDGMRLYNEGGVYKKEIEDFSVIMANGSMAGCTSCVEWFSVQNKDGSKCEYGNSSTSLIKTANNIPYIWRINRVIDNYGNEINYIYDYPENESRIREIHYGGNVVYFDYVTRLDKNSSFISNIPFDNNNGRMNNNSLLNTIRITNGSTMVKKYIFEYVYDGIYSFLIQAREIGSDGTTELNSTEMEYGSSKNLSSENIQERETNIELPNIVDYMGCENIPGDFNADGLTDILSIYYSVTDNNGNDDATCALLMQKVYRKMVVYLKNPNSNNFTEGYVYNIPHQHDMPFTGSYTYLFKVADFNGDGKSDILFDRYWAVASGMRAIEKRNFTIAYNSISTPSSQTVNFFFTDYNSTAYGDFDLLTGFHSGGTINTTQPENPLIIGDYDGDGKMDILHTLNNEENLKQVFVTFPSKNEFYSPVVAPYDMLPFTTPEDKTISNKAVSSADFDGDRRDEIFVNSRKILKIEYWFNNFYYLKNIAPPVNSFFQPLDEELQDDFVGDFNGDGKADILTIANSVFKVTYSGNGNNLNSPQLNGYSTIFRFHEPYFRDYDNYTNVNMNNTVALMVDYNGDGKCDMLFFNHDIEANITTLDIYYSNGMSFIHAPRKHLVCDYYQLDVTGDFNGDGAVDFIRKNVLWGEGSKPYRINYGYDNKTRLLKKVTNGFNITTEFSYKYLTETTSNYTRNYNGIIGDVVRGVKMALPVISSITVPDGIGGNVTGSFKYTDLYIHKKGKGLLGFASISSTESNTGITTLTTQKTPMPNTFFTMPVQKITRLMGNMEFESTTFETSFESLGNNRFYLKMDKSTEIDKIKGSTIVTHYTYDDFNNIINKTIINTGVESTSIDYDDFTEAGSSTIVSLPESIEITKTRGVTSFSKIIAIEYTSEGAIDNIIDFAGSPNAVTTHFEYDAFGNTIETIQSDGNITNTQFTSFTPDGRYFQSLEVDGVSGLTSVGDYDTRWGLPINISNYNGNKKIDFEYDVFGKVKKIVPKMAEGTLPLEINTTYSWSLMQVDNMYKVISIPSNNLPPVTKYYDAYNRLIKEESRNSYTEYKYNAKGEIMTVITNSSNGSPITTENTYDSYGRLVSSAPTIGLATRISYSVSGNGYTAIVTKSGNPTKATKVDASGQVISIVESGDNQSVTNDYVYHANGNLLNVVQAGKNLLTADYDDYGNRTFLKDINQGAEGMVYTFDAMGNILSQTDPNGNVMEFEYDNLGRMISQVITDASASNAENTTWFTYYPTNANGNGQLKKISYENTVDDNSDIEEYFEFDDYDRLIKGVKQFEGYTFQTDYAYGDFNRLASVTYPTLSNTNRPEISYDLNTADGLVKQVRVENGINNRTIFTASPSNYNAFDQVKKYKLGNWESKREYDELGRPTKYFTNYFLTANLQDLTMFWDANNGNLLWRKDASNLNGKRVLKEEFTYDGFNRLTKSTFGTQQLEISYNSIGNITKKYDAGSEYKYNENKIHAVEKIKASEYSNPVLNDKTDISTLQQDITYNAFNQPSLIVEGAGSALVKKMKIIYDYKGDRIKSIYTEENSSGVINTAKTVKRYYIGNYEFEKNHSDDVVRELSYIYSPAGLSAILRKEDNVFQYFYTYTDHLGSLVRIRDQNGFVLTACDQSFDAWGRARNPKNWTYTNLPAPVPGLYRGFTGHEMLPQFDLINMNGRLYDPKVGRMLSVDNVIQDPFNTQNFNMYSYVLNNPLKYIDPDGFRRNPPPKGRPWWTVKVKSNGGGGGVTPEFNISEEWGGYSIEDMIEDLDQGLDRAEIGQSGSQRGAVNIAPQAMAINWVISLANAAMEQRYSTFTNNSTRTTSGGGVICSNREEGFYSSSSYLTAGDGVGKTTQAPAPRVYHNIESNENVIFTGDAGESAIWRFYQRWKNRGLEDVIMVIGHGWYNHIEIETPNGSYEVRDPEDFEDLMTNYSTSTLWNERDNKQITVWLFVCLTADPEAEINRGQENIVKQISKANPNVIFIAPTGQCYLSASGRVTKIVNNGGGEGQFDVYLDGEIIYSFKPEVAFPKQ